MATMSLTRLGAAARQCSSQRYLLCRRTLRLYSSDQSPKYHSLLVETPKDNVALIRLHRPRALNALSTSLFTELNDALQRYDDDTDTGAIVLTGSEKAFAAGADIKEMKDLTYSSASNSNFIALWSQTIPNIRKPIIAAVNGHALGGGCELALMADMIYCSATASFGQPEIKLGVIPGAGGTQRLTRLLGKSKAMDIILTGRTFTGVEAERWGVAARCFETAEECVSSAVDTAAKIAGMSQVAVRAAKDAVNKSQEVGLRDGIDYERRSFHGLFGSKDQKIGMEAFLQKEKPEWKHQ